MSEELKCCPCCGSPAKKAKGSYFDKGVYCPNIKGCRIGGIIFHSEEEWNTRPDSNPYKYEDEFEAWCDSSQDIHGEGPNFKAGFCAARERKEG